MWCNLVNLLLRLLYIRLVYSRTILLIEIETELKHLSFTAEGKKREIFHSRSLFTLLSFSSITKMRRKRKSKREREKRRERRRRRRRFVIFLSSFTLSLLLTHMYLLICSLLLFYYNEYLWGFFVQVYDRLAYVKSTWISLHASDQRQIRTYILWHDRKTLYISKNV